MGPAGYDVQARLSATGVYALPIGRGKEYFPRESAAWLDEAIGGWKLSTAVVAYSGFPETITGRLETTPTAMEPTRASTNTAS